MDSDAVVAERFVRTILAKNWDAIEGQISTEMQFRALLPGNVVEVERRDAVVGELSDWFGPEIHIDSIDAVDVDSIGDKQRVSFRITARHEGNDQRYELEQYFYLVVDDGEVQRADVLCSGWTHVTDDA
jgi:hypothetical protein